MGHIYNCTYTLSHIVCIFHSFETRSRGWITVSELKSEFHSWSIWVAQINLFNVYVHIRINYAVWIIYCKYYLCFIIINLEKFKIKYQFRALKPILNFINLEPVFQHNVCLCSEYFGEFYLVWILKKSVILTYIKTNKYIFTLESQDFYTILGHI